MSSPSQRVKSTNKKSSKKPGKTRIVLTAPMKTQIGEAFEILDTDGDGLIDTNAIRVAIRALGFQPEMEEIKKMLSDVNKEGSETIDFADFLNIMTLKLNEEDTEEELREAFRGFADDTTATISISDLRRVSVRVGGSFGDEELEEMIDKADRNKNGLVCEEEFVKMMRKASVN